MNDWVDLPIINAIDYFQGLLFWFLNFARKYGSFFGLIGLIWTSVRLINSRIDMRSAWWDTLSKWLIFILLINFYYAGTSLISSVTNNIGLNAGNGKSTIINNFTSLKTRIEAELKLQEKWANGLTDLVNQELGIDLDYIDSNQDVLEYSVGVLYDVEYNYKFSSKQQKKEFEKKLKEYKKSFPDNDKTIWGAQTLEALNSVLIMTSADGSSKTDLTGAYVTDKPELNIWLRDSEGKATNYFSSSAIFRIGILAAQIIWEKASMDIIPTTNEDGDIEYNVKKSSKFQIKRIATYIMAGVCFLCIIFSVAFALIQYVMCILEFTIVQAIGAGFIPFYLFDGTKDIPKKLLPVFTGFAIKMLVMVICLIFVINMYLNFAADQISPTSGNMCPASCAECIFICLLSFILTSNAPKIAMTLLTGQPQLSMGEFMAAAGTFAGGAMGIKNLAATATSPAREMAKKKAHDWSEQRAASSSAKKQQEDSMKKNFASAHGIDTSTREGRKNLEKKWDVYRNSDGRSKKIDSKISTAGKNAADDVKQRQAIDYEKHGGVVGSAGRLLAHYTGAVANFKQTTMQGRNYNIPMSNLDIDKISTDSQLDPSVRGRKYNPIIPKTEDNTKTEDTKNGLPQDPNVGERQVE